MSGTATGHDAGAPGVESNCEEVLPEGRRAAAGPGSMSATA